jgi:hypothetical protein
VVTYRGNRFMFPKRPSILPLSGYLEAHSSRIKRPRREAVHSPPYSLPTLRINGAIPPLPLFFYGVYRDTSPLPFMVCYFLLLCNTFVDILASSFTSSLSCVINLL